MAPTSDDAAASSRSADEHAAGTSGASAPDGGAAADGAACGPFGPHRGRWGAARPRALTGLALPPAGMPAWRGTRPLKRWRYVGVFGERLMLCVGAAQVGPGRQSFWAIWDRRERRLIERTRLTPGGVRLGPGRVLVADRAGGVPIEIDLLVDEVDGVETISPHGGAYAWTRKQGGVAARGVVRIGGAAHELDELAVVDDSAGYHARSTIWKWSAGVGRTADGRVAAWNLVEGVHDAARASERTIWLDGEPVEAGPASFAHDLGGVTTPDDGELRFAAEAVRERNENLLLVRSSYRQPFGSFSGTLPGGAELAEGRGVMEAHTAVW